MNADTVLRVLFVDDEPQMLSSLRRVLAHKGLDWEITFALGANEALRILGARPQDVVVADMVMPDIDGSRFLREVHERWPTTLRIILSGNATPETLLKSVPLAHQFLAKPCPAEQLIEAVQSSHALRGLYMDEGIRQFVHGLDAVPVAPHVYTDLMRALRSDDCSVVALGEIIAQDLGLTAGILKLVNSPFFGLARRLTSPQQAVAFLGIGIIKDLVIYEHFFRAMRGPSHPGFDAAWLRAHSMQAALCCKEILRSEGVPATEQECGFSAGLLHDIGKIVLLEGASQYREVLQTSQEERLPLFHAEKKVLGFSHAEVGAYLLGIWGFSWPVVQAIAGHHHPRAHGLILPGAVLHVVDVFLHTQAPACSGAGAAMTTPPACDVAFLRDCGFENRVEAWGEIVASVLGAQENTRPA